MNGDMGNDGLNTRGVLTAGYLVCALFVAASFLGDIYRGDLPMWVGDAVRREWGRFGWKAAAFQALLFLFFYSSVFALPYTLLRIPFVNDAGPTVDRTKAACAIAAFWIGGTLLLLPGSVFAFIRALPGGALGHALVLGWLLLAAFVATTWWNLLGHRSTANL
jgi:hypothetical protein